MRIIRDLGTIKHYPKPVVAIGVFDGIHRAHRLIIRAAVAQARRIAGTSMVVTFWPLPRGKESLYSLEHRLRIMEELGVSVCVVIRFTKRFAALLAEDFVSRILVRRIGAHAVFVGENFRFGKNAHGDVQLLRRLSRQYFLRLKVFKTYRFKRRPVSSSLVRTLIAGGHLRQAEKLLLRRVSVFGDVVRGSALGTALGYPTANIDPHHEVVPPAGIYAVKVVFENRILDGACYIGTRPTFKTKKDTKNIAPRTIEVHLLHFKRNIYGKQLEVQFIRKVRDDKKFSSPGLLVKQIENDIKRVKKILSSR